MNEFQHKGRKPFLLDSVVSSEVQLIATFISIAILMGVYEFLKEIYFKGSLSLLESHTITVFVTAAFATAASYFIRRQALILHTAAEDAANMAEGVIRNIFDAVVIIDSDGIVSSFNPAAEKIFGYVASEVIGQNVNMLMSEPFASAHGDYIKRYLDTKVPAILGKSRREVPGRRANGEAFPMDLITSKMHFNEKMMFIGVIRDITEYKIAEGEIQRLRQAEKLVFENLKKDMLIAAAIQTNMLPRSDNLFPHHPEINAYGISRPAKEMGGDFYDAFALDAEHIVFAIGDVSGKGIPAALFMMETMALLRSKITKPKKFPTALLTVNRLLCKNNETNMFVSIFVGLLNVSTGNLSYISGGHEPPLVSFDAGSFKTLAAPSNILLGIHEDATFDVTHVNLKHGDTLLLYTDGVTEAENASGEFFTLQRALNTLSSTYSNAKVLVHSLLNGVDEFRREQPQSDDITIFAIQYVPDDLYSNQHGFFEWSEDFNVGVDVINEQHRTLVDLINRLYEEIVIKASNVDILEEVLEELVRYAIYHFEFEEKLLRNRGFSEMDAHSGYHAQLKLKLVSLRENSRSSTVTVNTELLSFLKGWLQQHIAVEDKGAFLGSATVNPTNRARVADDAL